jgi:hypothetical protein
MRTHESESAHVRQIRLRSSMWSVVRNISTPETAADPLRTVSGPRMIVPQSERSSSGHDTLCATLTVTAKVRGADRTRRVT